MSSFDVAHVRQQGQNMIIVPMADAFGYKTSSEQAAIERELARAAYSAGLAGEVGTVWNSAGSMAFRAPRPWHPFFKSISLSFVAANINKRITISR